MHGNAENVEVVAGNGDAEYKLTVKSESDVSSNYTITLSNVPSSVLVSLDGGTAKSPVDGNVVFDNAGTFNVNSGITERVHTLAFSTALSTESLNNNNVAVYVNFTQID